MPQHPYPQAPAESRLILDDMAATAALAARLGGLLRTGDVVALYGGLGAGKTAFARALIQSLQGPLGIEEEVPSPTFSLVQQYQIGQLSLWHFDLYRLSGPDETYELGMEEAFAAGVSLIEWPERLGPLLPADRLEIYLEFPPDAGIEECRRLVRLAGYGGWAKRMQNV
ncbi:MAG: tRNA threonylcarbamoyladenosine biosynthesis protein TsaE [Alphaproteobacteria bacterium]|nr:tRNA threonylcarbamoyladenosine biosynthesis protein TsaE [Alphaproteobacteria bacterium]